MEDFFRTASDKKVARLMPTAVAVIFFQLILCF